MLIRLDEDIVIKPSRKNKNTSDKKHIFASKVLEKMEQDSIAPTPYNYQIYFDTLLEGTPPEFKQDIDLIRQNEVSSGDGQRAKMEKEIKESFGVVKNMVQSITSVYKNITLVKGVIQKRTTELSSTTNQLAIQNITNNLEGDMKKFDTLVSRQLSSLKANYEQAVTSLKTIEQESIYDTRYSIYNKKYLLDSMQNELKAVSAHGYSTSLMFLKVKDTILSKIPHTKERLILTKNIAKLLQRTSRRSDAVAHYGEGIFAMLMRHTDIESAKKACERVCALVTSSSFFIGEMDIDMDIELAVIELDGKTPIEETLSLLLDALPKTSKDGSRYLVAKTLNDEMDW